MNRRSMRMLLTHSHLDNLPARGVVAAHRLRGTAAKEAARATIFSQRLRSPTRAHMPAMRAPCTSRSRARHATVRSEAPSGRAPARCLQAASEQAEKVPVGREAEGEGRRLFEGERRCIHGQLWSVHHRSMCMHEPLQSIHL